MELTIKIKTIVRKPLIIYIYIYIYIYQRLLMSRMWQGQFIKRCFIHIRRSTRPRRWVSTVPGEHCQKIAVSNPTQAGQRFTRSQTWCDRQQLWKTVITGDTVTRLSIPIRGRGKITWRRPEVKFGRNVVKEEKTTRKLPRWGQKAHNK